MLERKIINTMREWKQNKTHQGLLLTGARQVGKTTAVRMFAQDNYSDLAEVNFLGNTQAIETVSQARDADDLIFRLSVLTGKRLDHTTLLFLDEVQECQDLLTWVKFLAERNNDLDIVLSGSLLGIDAFVNARSLPVGFLQSQNMYPLDFEEFCWAFGLQDDVWSRLREYCISHKPVPNYLHDRFTDLFRKYLIVGGMPDAVQAFVNDSEIVPVRNVQRNIVSFYEDDIAKYISNVTEQRQAKMVYQAIPGQLNAPSKRFKYARLDKNLRFANMETAFDWLNASGVALAASRVGSINFPVGLSEDRNSFKLFMNDVGLLTSQLMGDVSLEVINGKTNVNYGSIFENVVAQEFASRGLDLHYYFSKQIGEVDFIVENKSNGKVIPVDVKSGKNYKRHSALTNLMKIQNDCDAAIVLYDGNGEVRGKVAYLPVYTAGEILLQLQ